VASRPSTVSSAGRTISGIRRCMTGRRRSSRRRLRHGYESGTTVTPDYTASTSRFTGRINWVQIDLGDDDNDHFIDPDERLRVAMARQ